MQAPIGIVGLGLVGSAIAQRLLSAQYQVLGYDISPERCGELAELGGQRAASGNDVFKSCDRVILSLPTSEIAQAVCTVASNVLRGKMILDTTTGEPEEMAQLGRDVEARGGKYLVATIAGSSTLVRRGEALLMLGGPAEIATACDNLLQTFSSRRFYLGDWTAAARMKLVVNLVLGLHRAVLAEGLSFASACGIDPRMALEVLKAGPAYSKAMDTKGERMIARDFAPEARLAQHAKDVGLILEQGQSLNARMPLSSLHQQLLQEVIALGYGEEDNCAIMRAFTQEPG